MAIVNGYVTLAEAVEYIGRSEARDSAELEDVITSASRLIDRFCGRHFWQATATTRKFDSPDGYRILFGPYNDVVSVTSVASDSNDDGTYDATLTATEYQLTPADAATRGPVAEPFTGLQLLNISQAFPLAPAASGRTGLISITGNYGWPAVPPEVKQACRILSAELYKMADSPMGAIGMGEFGVMRVSSTLPPRARQLLMPFRHPLNFGAA
jgi:hypothetical protein